MVRACALAAMICCLVPGAMAQEQGASLYDQLQTKQVAQDAFQGRCEFSKIHGGDRNIFIQLGYMDDAKGLSADAEIGDDLEMVLKSCGFSPIGARVDGLSVLRKEIGANTSVTVRLQRVTRDGNFDRDLSEEALAKLPARISAADDLIYFGHARHGSGADLFPKGRAKHSGHVIPVFTRSWVRGLPTSLKSLMLIACRSARYAALGGGAAEAKSRELQLFTYGDGVFDTKYFIKYVLDLFEQIE